MRWLPAPAALRLNKKAQVQAQAFSLHVALYQTRHEFTGIIG